MEAKKTQADLLESLAARSNDSNIMAARIQDLEEQFRQEVSAKEYFSLELHKAEGEGQWPSNHCYQQLGPVPKAQANYLICTEVHLVFLLFKIFTLR